MALGQDRIGRFLVLTGEKPRHRGPACSWCGMRGQPLVRYTGKLRVAEKVECAPSWIGRGRRTFGISCGCYSNLHRQLVHIEEGIQRHAE